MGRDLIKRINANKNGVWFTSTSVNDDNLYQYHKVMYLTDVYLNEGQYALDKAIVDLITDNCVLEGDHPSLNRYYAFLDDKECMDKLEALKEDKSAVRSDFKANNPSCDVRDGYFGEWKEKLDKLNEKENNLIMDFFEAYDKGNILNDKENVDFAFSHTEILFANDYSARMNCLTFDIYYNGLSVGMLEYISGENPRAYLYEGTDFNYVGDEKTEEFFGIFVEKEYDKMFEIIKRANCIDDAMWSVESNKFTEKCPAADNLINDALDRYDKAKKEIKAYIKNKKCPKEMLSNGYIALTAEFGFNHALNVFKSEHDKEETL